MNVLCPVCGVAKSHSNNKCPVCELSMKVESINNALINLKITVDRFYKNNKPLQDHLRENR